MLAVPTDNAAAAHAAPGKALNGKTQPADDRRVKFRDTVVAVVLAVLAVLTTAASGQTEGPGHSTAMADPREATPPNVIFIVLDTARADRMSYNSYHRVTTPYLDAFARDGVIYRNAHSVAPWTLPSHMSMFTGLLPGQHGATWRAFATPDDMTLGDLLNRSFRFADGAQLLPQRLRDRGYATVAFTSNAWVSRRTGFDHGFDHFYEMWQGSPTRRRAYDWLPPGIRLRLDWLPAPLRTVSELDVGDGGLVLTALQEHVDTHGALRAPFFLFFNFIDPHFPYSPPLAWRYAFSTDTDLGERIARFAFDEMSMQAGERPVDVGRFSSFYDAEINYLDFSVGRLLGWLREQGYYEDALIVIVSDHGEHLGEHGRFSHQFSVDEELLRIPFLIKFPRGAQRGRVIDNPLVSNIDVYETILRAAQARQQEGSARSVSQDLGNMDRFNRRYLIAESDYSLPYLRLNQARSPNFSIEENQVVRRVVFDREQRHVFVERDGTDSAAAVRDSVQPGRQAAQAALQEYVRSLRNGRLQETDRGMDPATRERLRSLGYVD